MSTSRPDSWSGYEFNLPPADSLIGTYERNGYVALPSLLSPDEAVRLLGSTSAVKKDRVRCGLENVTWQSQSFWIGDAAYHVFLTDQVMEFMCRLVGAEKMDHIQAWSSCYDPGEYINPHRDRHGTVQLLICLEGPTSPEQGGSIVLGGERLFLHPGDGVAFAAIQVEHYTIPASVPRTVLVGRYYMDE